MKTTVCTCENNENFEPVSCFLCRAFQNIVQENVWMTVVPTKFHFCEILLFFFGFVFVESLRGTNVALWHFVRRSQTSVVTKYSTKHVLQHVSQIFVKSHWRKIRGNLLEARPVQTLLLFHAPEPPSFVPTYAICQSSGLSRIRFRLTIHFCNLTVPIIEFSSDIFFIISEK